MEDRVRSLLRDIDVATSSDVSTLAEETAFRSRHNVFPYSSTMSNRLTSNVTSELDVTIRGLEMATVELATSLCSGLPKVMTAELQDEFMNLWSKFPEPPQQLFSILSARNIKLLAASPNPSQTWDKMEFLLGRLLRKGLILPIVLEDECLHFLKQTWPAEILQRFGSCVKSVVETWKREHSPQDPCSQGFNQEFVEWIAWFVGEAAADELEDNLDSFPELM